MNPAIQCIVLLACISICSSAAIKNCQCVRTSLAIRRYLIIDVKEEPPRPYCSRSEVIVTLKDKRKVCLDPKSQFTKILLQTSRMIKASQNPSITATAATSSVIKQ
ncbi:growth-regulated alpha protein-like [Girardinichthys multiradiatus]|uniref:growth-regulated alpha protein-like n=1 Tax=Girardinichthys multiradiatus TaxID=208333 RepID=UPI001FAD7172|nr:growth-regulated alpha protein-like [Girardinichthys multiradiatus]